VEELKVDAIVIGSGPGGEGAAMQLAKTGKQVMVVERYEKIGGGCTHWGTIPSKALKFAIGGYTEAMNHPIISAMGIKPDASIATLVKAAQNVISSQETMRRNFYTRNDCRVEFGQARFVDANTIAIGDSKKVSADHVVVAVGSRPYRPENIDFDDDRIFDSDTILALDHKPQSMTIYGAGVIGCEYASMFRNLGIKINLVNSRDGLLDFLDDEISDALSYHMREQGVVIRHNESYEKIVGEDDGVVTYLESGKQLKSDALLWAAGRTGNSNDLGLDNIGLVPDSRGCLEVAAYSQGRAAAKSILGETGAECRRLQGIPSGIYTSPEISSIGKTEKQLTEEKVPYEVGISQFKNLARAQILGKRVGMLKLLFHRETLELLGVHCFGPNAAEIVHIGQAIMEQEGEANSLKYFTATTFNYPTMAEAYRVAALNGLNRLF